MQIETGPLDIIDRNHWEAFRLKYPGDEHLRLACHAAFPVALTPDLLYKIWLNFRQPESTTEPLELLATVSDILRSPLCREIGRDIYEMHPDIRTALLEALQNDPENGHERILDLARFLRDYLRHNPDKLPSASFREAQNWVAESYLEPEKAAKTILDLLEQEDQDPNAAHKVDFFLSWTKQRNHLQRSATTDNAGADVLLATEEIVQGFRQYRVGDMEGALERFRYIEPFVEAGDGNGMGFKATIPGEVWQAMHKPVTAQAKQRSLAFKLIEKEKRERTGVLDLGNCGLREVPEEVFELEWLETLILSNKWWDWDMGGERKSNNTGYPNILSTIPSSVYKLINISKLIFSGEKDNKWGLRDLKNISKLNSLKALIIRHNEITDLNSLEKLTNLRYLDLWDNKISNIVAIGNLKNLIYLSIFGNNVTDLKPIGRFIKLFFLDIRNNKIKDLYPIVELFRNGVVIYHEENPVENPPSEIRKQGLNAIINYFQELKAQKDRIFKITEARLFILGEAGAGKTSLVRKLLNPNTPLPLAPETTSGIDISSLEITLPDGSECLLNVWGFGGQEIYHATHQFFLTKRSLYLLVMDNRKQDFDLYYWLQIVSIQGEGSPLVIVINEKDMHSIEFNSHDIKERFAFVKDTVILDIATERGMSKLRSIISENIMQLPHIGVELPNSWFSIRQELEQLEKKYDYISIEEFYKICSKHEILEQEKALFLSSYFHDIGIFLHFQNHTQLHTVLLLNKQWVIDAIYAVFNSKVAIFNYGRFTHKDFVNLWIDKRHFDNKIILALMEKFEICFKLAEEKVETWLVPQLLPMEKPERFAWNDTDNLQIRYEYEFIPKGLLAQHIVRMNQYVHRPDLAWRYGVVLERDETQALVQESYATRTISIRVRGNNSKELLPIISEDFDKIHERFKGLKVRKMIPCNCKNCLQSKEPYFYNFEELINRFKLGKNRIECAKSYEEISVSNLLNDYQSGIHADFNERILKAVDFSEAVSILDEMRRSKVLPDTVTFNSIISKASNFSNAHYMLELMRKDAIPSNTQTFNILITKTESFSDAHYLLREMQEMGVKPDVVTFNSLVTKADSFSNAHYLLREMQELGIRPDVVTFNSLVGKADSFSDAHYLLREMQELGVRPDVVTFNSIVAKADSFSDAHYLLREMQELGIRPDVVTFNSLVGKADSFSDAHYLLREMQELGVRPDVVTFNSIVAKADSFSDAHYLLREMQELGIRPDVVTFNSLVGKADSFSDAYYLLREMQEMGVSPDAVTFNSLIGKTESFNDADQLLKEMGDLGVRPDIVTFNQMMDKCSDYTSALGLFEKMSAEGLLPNEYSYSILVNCSPDYQTAWRWSEEMQSKGFVPNEAVVNFLNEKKELLENIRKYPENYSKWRIEEMLGLYNNNRLLTKEDIINSGIITRAGLELLLSPPSFLDEQYGWNDLPPLPTDKTDIYFFGIPCSGKSCLLSGLLYYVYTQGLLQLDSNNMAGRKYANALLSLIGSNYLGYVPPSTTSEGVNYITVELQSDNSPNQKVHPINLFEMSGELFTSSYKTATIAATPSDGRNTIGMNAYLSNDNRKVIFFVIDYIETVSPQQSQFITRQALQFEVILDLLDKEGILSKTDALHIVLTKSDRMPGGAGNFSATEEIIGREYKNLHNSIRKYRQMYKFKDCRIIPFSLGKFMLNQVFEYDPTYSENIYKAIVASTFIRPKTKRFKLW